MTWPVFTVRDLSGTGRNGQQSAESKIALASDSSDFRRLERSSGGRTRGGAPATGGLQSLLLGLQVLRAEARPLDRELFCFAMRRPAECIQKARHFVELGRLEERLEVVVREATVASHFSFVRLQ